MIATQDAPATTDHDLAAAIRSAQNDLNAALCRAAEAGLTAKVSVATSPAGTSAPRVVVAIERKIVL
jgi:hypothetical protein